MRSASNLAGSWASARASSPSRAQRRAPKPQRAAARAMSTNGLQLGLTRCRSARIRTGRRAKSESGCRGRRKGRADPTRASELVCCSRPFPGWNSSRPHLGICWTDHGALYAAKDMLDPVHGRRIYWGWNAYVAPAQGGLSLPRELTWHPELQQLVHSPLPELSLLRAKPALARVAPPPSRQGRPSRLAVGCRRMRGCRRKSRRLSRCRSTTPASAWS